MFFQAISNVGVLSLASLLIFAFGWRLHIADNSLRFRVSADPPRSAGP